MTPPRGNLSVPEPSQTAGLEIVLKVREISKTGLLLMLIVFLLLVVVWILSRIADAKTRMIQRLEVMVDTKYISTGKVTRAIDVGVAVFRVRALVEKHAVSGKTNVRALPILQNIRSSAVVNGTGFLFHLGRPLPTKNNPHSKENNNGALYDSCGMVTCVHDNGY